MAEDVWNEKPRGFKVATIPDVRIYHASEMDAWLEKMKTEIDRFKEKAELWDQYAIYDNDKEGEILVKDLLTAYEKLEAVKDWHKTQVKDYSYIRDSYQGKTRTHAGTVLKNLERLGEILEAGF